MKPSLDDKRLAAIKVLRPCCGKEVYAEHVTGNCCACWR